MWHHLGSMPKRIIIIPVFLPDGGGRSEPPHPIFWVLLTLCLVCIGWLADLFLAMVFDYVPLLFRLMTWLGT